MGVTQELASFVAGLYYDDLPPAAVHEAKRCLLDWIGNALGGSRDEPVDLLLATLEELGGTPQASVVGRSIRTSLTHAALLNGYLSHVLDFDDTLTDTVLHPTSPVMPALVALAERDGASGRDLITAFVAGFEVEARLAQAIFPSHYEAGWHITGTAGAVGAAAAASRLLGLDPQRTLWALGIGATQPTGLREHFGTMTKALHPGRAAGNGLLATLLAQRGFTAAEASLEGPNGFLRAMAAEADLGVLTRGLGQDYLICTNGYKPYACGVVNHPIIDGAIHLRNTYGISPEQVDAIEVRASDRPPIPQLAANPDPQTGLSGKFSLAHCAAVGLVDGVALPAQFTDARVRDPQVAALRRRFRVTLHPTVRETEAYVTAVLKDGRRLEVHIPHATGTQANPMSDAALEAKYRGQAGAALPPEQVDAIARLVWDLETLADLRDLAGRWS
ncbi:MAG: MmgE/PrpD family protein [Chloroflexi bacterium]|nr:MmgE/PrpD family protein [Chloroflexota bacterium]